MGEGDPVINSTHFLQQVYKGHRFYSVSSVAEDVPVLVCGGLSKRYLVPGWRVGWVILHDRLRLLDTEVGRVCR